MSDDVRTSSEPSRDHFWALAPWLFVLLWAGGYAFGKLGLPYIEPLTMLMVRYAIAMVLLTPFFFLTGAELPKGREHWTALIITGFLIQSIYFGLAYLAIKNGMDAGTIALLFSLQPILVAVLAPMLVGESVSRLCWFGLILGFAGTIIVILAKNEVGGSSWISVGLAFGALTGITAATLFEKRFGRKTHPVTNGLVQYAVGFLTIMPVALVLETQTIIWHQDLVISMTYLVLANSLISISLLVGLIQRGSASKVSALFYVIPPVSLLYAWIMLGETMPPLAWGGFALCMAGILIVNKAQ